MILFKYSYFSENLKMVIEKLDLASTGGIDLTSTGALYAKEPNPDDDVLDRPLLVIIR